MKRILIALFIFLITGMLGCSTIQKENLAELNNQNQTFQSFLTAIGKVTNQDLDTALADVHKHGDQDFAALQCYPAIKEFLGLGLTLTNPTVDGIFSANQIKRDILIGGAPNGGNPFQVALRKLHVACAAYMGDEVRFAAEFTVMIGAASHGVSALPGIPGAIGGAIGGILPKP